MYDLKGRLDCSFEFKFNSEKMHIVMACVLPSEYILTLFVIQRRDDLGVLGYGAHQVFADDK